MSLLSLLSFLLPISSGMLIIRLLFGKRPPNLILQLALGSGLGLGISSLLYYASLNFFDGGGFFYAEAALFAAALAASFKNEKPRFTLPSLNLSQALLPALAALTTALSLIGVADYSRQRAHGDWDAWMIYNRAARFIFRAPENWRDAFSPDMNLVFHADYPPLLALNIASRWQMLRAETLYVPMILGFLFTLAAFGACFGALANLKSAGQGALGLIFLAGVGFFPAEGGRQTADMPLAFFILASIAFLFFRQREDRPIFMAASAFMAALAAWTKNEGMLFILAAAGVLFLAALWKRSFLDFLFYLAGAFLPLILLFHFKTQVAPASEFAGGGLSALFEKISDPSRHRLIFDSLADFFLRGGGWLGVGVFPILAAWFFLFRAPDPATREAALIAAAILAAQFIGYYLSYLISPYDLNWHIAFSINRLFVHVYPATVFVILATAQSPESVFGSG